MTSISALTGLPHISDYDVWICMLRFERNNKSSSASIVRTIGRRVLIGLYISSSLRRPADVRLYH
jgi:hypothetical protein